MPIILIFIKLGLIVQGGKGLRITTDYHWLFQGGDVQGDWIIDCPVPLHCLQINQWVSKKCFSQTAQMTAGHKNVQGDLCNPATWEDKIIIIHSPWSLSDHWDHFSSITKMCSIIYRSMAASPPGSGGKRWWCKMTMKCCIQNNNLNQCVFSLSSNLKKIISLRWDPDWRSARVACKPHHPPPSRSMSAHILFGFQVHGFRDFLPPLWLAACGVMLKIDWLDWSGSLFQIMHLPSSINVMITDLER